MGDRRQDGGGREARRGGGRFGNRERVRSEGGEQRKEEEEEGLGGIEGGDSRRQIEGGRRRRGGRGSWRGEGYARRGGKERENEMEREKEEAERMERESQVSREKKLLDSLTDPRDVPKGTSYFEVNHNLTSFLFFGGVECMVKYIIICVNLVFINSMMIERVLNLNNLHEDAALVMSNTGTL